MHEAQVHYVLRALTAMSRWRIGALEVRRRVMDRYNRRIQAAMKGTVWLAGCRNYYCTPDGKVVTQLPYSRGRYWLRTRLLRIWNYRFGQLEGATNGPPVVRHEKPHHRPRGPAGQSVRRRQTKYW